MNASTSTLSHDEQQTDVQRVISGAEDLLREAATTGGEKGAELRERALGQLRALRERVADAQHAALEKTRAAAHAADDYVHEHPWRVIAAAAGIGVAIGLLLNRR